MFAEFHDEAFCCAAGFQEFGEFDLNDFEAELFELAAQLAADPVENDGAAYVDGVAGKADGIGFADDDSFFGRVEGFDPVQGEVIEGVGEVHDVAAIEWSEAGVEVVEAGIDEVKRHDGNVQDVMEHTMAGCAVRGP